VAGGRFFCHVSYLPPSYLFGLAIDNIAVILTVTIIGTLLGVISCMLLVALAANKVEGLALSKLTNILALGFPAAWFLAVPHKYLFAFLPSFWMGEVVYKNGADLATILLLGFGGVVSAAIWIGVLLNMFVKRAV
jgi:fluoroquinolone transport system permease protein